MSSIDILLRENGWMLPSYAPGEYQCICPKCSHLRKPIHQKQKCAKVWIESNEFATYSCLNCGDHGVIKPEKVAYKSEKYTKPFVTPQKNIDLAQEFLKKRGISKGTADYLGWFVKDGKIAFPFYKNGSIVNVKYRGIVEKTFLQEKNPEPVLYNYDNAFAELKNYNNTLIIVEGECFTGDTEILTEKGWVRFADYQGENVYQVNDDLSLELTKPRAIIKKDFSGNLIRCQNKNLDILATPGHNMVYSYKNVWHKRKLAEMPKSISGYIPTAGLLNGKGLPLSDDYIRLLVAVSADGSIGAYGHIRLSVKKERKANRIKELLKSCDIQATQTKQSNGYFYFGFYLPGAFKIFPTNWLFETTIKQKKVILNEIVFWDGNRVPNRTMTEYSTKEYENALFVQTLCHLSGFNSSIICRKNQFGSWYKITMLWNKNHVSWQNADRFVSKKFYQGKVYCVSVPTGKIITRNNKKITIIGNCDCATMVEAGYKNCVSLPSGSDAQVRDKGYQGSKFDFLKTSAPLLGSAKRIILALDSDPTGQAMTQSLINMLPEGTVFLVDWSVYRVDGKDANDFWLKDKSIIKDAIDNVKLVGGDKITVAIDDVERLESYMLNGVQGGYKTGFDNIDFVTFMPGDFVTVTGYPSSGKSTWVMSLMLNMVAQYELRCLYCGFENPKDQIVSRLLQTRIGKPTFGGNLDTIAECREHYSFLNEHFLLLDDTAEILSIDKLLSNIQAVIMQKNIDMIVIDPFNKLEFSRSKDQSGDIGAVLNKLIAFAHKNKILMFLVAHPTKPNNDKRKIGGQDIPSGFDVAGSANFQNMSDAVISVHRQQDEFGQKSDATRVTVSKWRFGERGREGSAFFKYNPLTARYTTLDLNEYKFESNNIPRNF